MTSASVTGCLRRNWPWRWMAGTATKSCRVWSNFWLCVLPLDSRVLVNIITASDPSARNQSLDTFCRPASLPTLLAECAELDALRRRSDNLYERVRALFFLYAIHRFHIPEKAGLNGRGLVPFKGYEQLLNRRFEEAI